MMHTHTHTHTHTRARARAQCKRMRLIVKNFYFYYVFILKFLLCFICCATNITRLYLFHFNDMMRESSTFKFTVKYLYYV